MSYLVLRQKTNGTFWPNASNASTASLSSFLSCPTVQAAVERRVDLLGACPVLDEACDVESDL